MRRPVSNALQHWCNEGLLSAEQAAALAASIESVEKPLESARAVRVFGFIGAILTGLGAILFVASNWQGMSPTQRTLALLVAYGLSVGAAVFAEKRALPLVAEAVWLMSTLVLGANIFLIAQTHNLTLTLWQGTLAWTVGALAMGYARQSRAQAAVAVPLAILTLGWAGGGAGFFFDDQMEFLYADAGLRPLLPLMGLALVGLSTLLARRDDLRFARLPCFRWGVFLLAATLIISTVDETVATWLFAADFTGKQVVLLIASIAMVVAGALAGKVEFSGSRPVFVGLLVLLLALLVPHGDATWLDAEINGVHVLFGLYVVVVFSIALLAIWLGMQARNPRLVNVGMMSTTLIIIIQYFGWTFDLMDRSLAFIIGGMVLIGLSAFVEKQRRRIMVQMAA